MSDNTLVHQLVSRWMVRAAGHRPKDFMARDLLLGSLFRDRRSQRFRRLVRGYREVLPDWLALLVGSLSPRDRNLAFPLLVLVYKWQRFIVRLGRIPTDTLAAELGMDETGGLHQEAIPDAGLADGSLEESAVEEAVDGDFAGEGYDYNEPDEDEILHRQLLNCRPYGARLMWNAPQDPPARKICNWAQLCPWCYARRVRDLYQQLQAGPLHQPAEDVYLVQLTVSIPPDMVFLDTDWTTEQLRQFGRSLRFWAVMDDDHFNFRRIIRQEDISWLQRHALPQVQQLARLLGIDDGLLIHQVGPDRTQNEDCAFRHIFTILGTVALRTSKDMERFKETAGITGRYWVLRTPVGNQQGLVEMVKVLALPASLPNALRYLLCGTSARFAVDTLPLIIRDDEVGHLLKHGVPGAFRLQPLYLFDPIQWGSFTDVMKDRPLYVLFGSWRAAVK